MDAVSFVAKIRRLNPVQSVTLRFSEDGMSGLRRLRGFLGSATDPRVRLADRDRIILMVVTSSGDWGGSHNRNYTVYGLSLADEGWLNAIARDVESLAVAEHAAMGIMSGRQKVRDQASEMLVASIFTEAFKDEIYDWGFGAFHSFAELEGLPYVAFNITAEDGTVTTVTIDGWSGRIAVDGRFTDEIYIEPQQVQNLLRERMEALLEKLTA